MVSMKCVSPSKHDDVGGWDSRGKLFGLIISLSILFEHVHLFNFIAATIGI